MFGGGEARQQSNGDLSHPYLVVDSVMHYEVYQGPRRVAFTGLHFL